MRAGEVGLELRRARQRAALTQAALARRMGTTQSAVARAESGAVLPSMDFIERFAVTTCQPLRLGSLLVYPVTEEQESAGRRRDRVRRALGEYRFNPWLRNPSDSEKRSLESDGLTRESFGR